MTRPAWSRLETCAADHKVNNVTVPDPWSPRNPGPRLGWPDDHPPHAPGPLPAPARSGRVGRALAACTPRRHGGGRTSTVRRGDAARLPARRPGRVRARGGREADPRRRSGRDPRRDARPDHQLQRRGAGVHARRSAPLPARRARQSRQRASHPARGRARQDSDDRAGARLRPARGRRGEPRDQERAHRSRLRLDSRLRQPGHGRGAAQPPAAPAAAGPELHPGQPGRGSPAPAGGGHQPSESQRDGRGVPGPGDGEPLRLDLTRVAGEPWIRPARPGREAASGAVHARHGHRGAGRCARRRGRSDQRRSAWRRRGRWGSDRAA